MKQPKMWKEVNRNKNRKNKEVNKSIKDYQNYKESIKSNNKKDKKEKIKFQRNRRKSWWKRNENFNFWSFICLFYLFLMLNSRILSLNIRSNF